MTPSSSSSPSRCRFIHFLLAVVLVGGCSSDRSGEPAGGDGEAATAVATVPPGNATRIVELLEAGQPVFGAFPGPSTREQGAMMGRNRELDFVFYSLESGPFDLETAGEYLAGIADGSGDEAPHPLILRIPPIRNGEETARANVAAALGAGMAGIVFPHVESAMDAEVAVSAMGDQHWPGNPDGSLFSILIVEDRSGVERLDEIVGTAGVSVVFAGPGDLRRSYEGDMEAVEAAIQAVLAACQAHGVPCGVTAGPDDIAERIEQGFRMFIVSDPEAVTVGRAYRE